MMKIRIKDKYNPFKYWIVKISASHHYYVNQEIKGLIVYKSFQRVTKRHLTNIGLEV